MYFFLEKIFFLNRSNNSLKIYTFPIMTGIIQIFQEQHYRRSSQKKLVAKSMKNNIDAMFFHNRQLKILRIKVE